MEKRNTYNLRPRKINPHKTVPRPQIGDRVSIFWESLDDQYEGTLIKFDRVHKTFLVEYDNIPEGYDDDRIWEDLDCVPWRFLDKFEQRKSRRVWESARKHSGLRDIDHGDMVDDGKLSQWFQPGELSSVHAQFCTPNDGSWYRRKRKKKLKEICDSGSSSSDEDDEEEMVLESEDDEEESEDNSRDDDEEILDVLGGYEFIEGTCSPNISAEKQREVRNILRVKKRTYANFGALGFNAVQENLFADVAPTSDDFNSSLCFGQDTIRVNCSRNPGMKEHSQARVGSNETKQSNSFSLRTGSHIVYPSETAGRDDVEEQIRSITRTFGISK